MPVHHLDTCELGVGDAPKLRIARVVTGLWQVADMERQAGRALDADTAADAMVEYVDAGFHSFDMADHYGTSELITKRCLEKLRARGDGAKVPEVFTKWCPQPGAMTAEAVRAGVQARLDRLGVAAVDLLQFHWWQYEHLAYVDAARELGKLQQEGLVRHLGLTNFDTDHLRVVNASGAKVCSNQVCFSLLDRRAAGAMTEYCLQHGVKLLCYGTLGGGFLSEKWLGAPEPTPAERDAFTWSQAKYYRFVEGIGGWAVLQGILEAAAGVAKKHNVSVSNVATRWVLEQPAVAAVLVGARLGESEHRADNAKVFSFAFDADDHAAIGAALQAAKTLPGDCGDEYRRPPFLTASGDLTHHLTQLPQYYTATPTRGGRRSLVDSGTSWEIKAGFARATRQGDVIHVSGTTATHGDDPVCEGDPHGQAVFALDKIVASVAALGGTREDIIRTRIYMTGDTLAQWEGVAEAHGRYLWDVRPANTLIGVHSLVGPYDVEIEAEALVAPQPAPPAEDAATRQQ
eukprot:TRINITY_DN10453_c0_g1_i2.p1 TRINITY_DN10453_c0_g1~~TRINITY_DN10453_c0_g1_i2.p1  ORF type:complete len:516 (+),score=195.48 TRINITY_DN10453_c0_g1_i2:43-1590(+)